MPELKKKSLFSLRTMVCCAMMIAVAVVMARLMSVVPDKSSRFSLESIPIFVSGMLFGPVAGALVGFTSDLIGCLLFSAYVYNPLFCLPPVVCGVCAGLFRKYLFKKTNVFRIALAFLPYILFACILWQSLMFTLVEGGDAKTAYFLTKLATRSVQFGITYVIDVILVWILYKSKVFTAAKLWPVEKDI